MLTRRVQDEDTYLTHVKKRRASDMVEWRVRDVRQGNLEKMTTQGCARKGNMAHR